MPSPPFVVICSPAPITPPLRKGLTLPHPLPRSGLLWPMRGAMRPERAKVEAKIAFFNYALKAAGTDSKE